MKKHRIFLTGSSGFIGRNIANRLGDKYEIVAPSHKELNLVDTQAVDNFFRKHKPFDAVVHSAFIGGKRGNKDNSQTLQDNLRIFFNLVRNKRYFKKFINLGSGAEYGKQMPLKKVSEEDFDKVIPLSGDYYGFAKYIIAKYIENSEDLVNLRLFGVYGKHEDSSLRFISNTICKSILKMPLTINQNVYFEYLYIDDFVRILEHFLTHRAKRRSYNVGRGKPIDLVSIANKINRIADFKSPVVVKRSGIANEYSCKNTAVVKALGNFKFTDFDQSLKSLYSFYMGEKNKLKKKDFLFDN